MFEKCKFSYNGTKHDVVAQIQIMRDEKIGQIGNAEYLLSGKGYPK